MVEEVSLACYGICLLNMVGVEIQRLSCLSIIVLQLLGSQGQFLSCCLVLSATALLVSRFLSTILVIKGVLELALSYYLSSHPLEGGISDVCGMSTASLLILNPHHGSIAPIHALEVRAEGLIALAVVSQAHEGGLGHDGLPHLGLVLNAVYFD